MPLTAPLPHPARYSAEILPILEGFLQPGSLVLDPFGGTGERAEEVKHVRWIRLEIEKGWADVVQGSALNMPFKSQSFDAICTSPTYGNRMADHHAAKDKSKRVTYRHKLGRPLHPENSGQLQWGDDYRKFHEIAWRECRRVLKPGGRFVLNVSDHIRSQQRQHVTSWHIQTLRSLGFYMQVNREVQTRRMGFGQNGAARVGYESVILFGL